MGKTLQDRLDDLTDEWKWDSPTTLAYAAARIALEMALEKYVPDGNPAIWADKICTLLASLDSSPTGRGR